LRIPVSKYMELFEKTILSEEENMIKSNFGHLQVNIYPQNIAFYKELFAFLGWSVLYEDPNMIGVGCEKGSSLWFAACAKAVNNDYDGPGANHIALSVDSQDDVDQTVTYLQQHKVEALFETPRHRPEFCSGPDKTYYQVMFESPDRILFEVVYTGLLSK
jgi:catechol 2,3-dioxygenase-like lactoylglutathione lyase family enzyme